MNLPVQAQTPQPVVQTPPLESAPGQEPTMPTIPSAPEGQPKPSRKSLVVLVILLVLLAVVGTGLYFLLQRTEGTKPTVPSTQRPTLPSPTPQPTERFSVDTEVTDTFDGLNKENWSPFLSGSRSTIEAIGGKIVINIAQGENENSSGILNSTAFVAGDFEVSVDVEIVKGDQNSETVIIFHDDIDGWPNSLAVILQNEKEGSTNIRAVSVENGQDTVLGFETYVGSGPFTVRIIRSGSTVRFMVGEALLGQVESGIYQGGGRLSLVVDSYEPVFPSAISTFDNFVLKPL